MGPAWSECPECGTRLKTDAMAGHARRVHHGARTRLLDRAGRSGLVIVGVAVLVAAAVALVRLGSEEAPPLGVTDDPFLGDPDAPLTVYLFEDYQCPFCRRFELEGNLDRLIADWVEPGKVRIVYKDLAFLGEDSIAAASASQCVWAAAPDRWHEWSRMVFTNQGAERSGWASSDNLKVMTERWGGVAMTAFSPCLDRGEWRDEVQGDIREARDAGVASTPTIVVGGKRLNANDLPSVEAAIREALDKVEA